jgi:pimeloyl-ACP methyl ester carboxylesterase
MKVPVTECIHRSRVVDVDGMRTHYLEGGDGPPVVLLHSGEFGACAELSWEYMIAPLSRHFRVIAPDWLGFGKTAKIHDFEGKRQRMLSHLVRFVEVMALDRAYFVGNSMGGTYLLQLASERPCRLPILRMVVISGGGFVPANDSRQHLLDYDGSEASMVRLLRAIFVQPEWYTDEDYVRRRHALSLAPGAWECVAAARFKSPMGAPRSEFGNTDDTPYGNIGVPALLIAGGRDGLRLPGYANELARRIPDARLALLPDAGHCPNIEHADEVAALTIEFLKTSGSE